MNKPILKFDSIVRIGSNENIKTILTIKNYGDVEAVNIKFFQITDKKSLEYSNVKGSYCGLSADLKIVINDKKSGFVVVYENPLTKEFYFEAINFNPDVNNEKEFITNIVNDNSDYSITHEDLGYLTISFYEKCKQYYINKVKTNKEYALKKKTLDTILIMIQVATVIVVLFGFSLIFKKLFLSK